SGAKICCEFLQHPADHPSWRWALMGKLHARGALALTLTLLPLLASGHAVGATPADQSPAPLVIDTTAEAESLDPALVTQVSGFSIMGSLFDNLVERDYGGALVPMLAESWSFPDPNTIEFKLRQGVSFHNG